MGADLGHGISAAERVGKHSEKLLSSSGRIASSTVSIPRRLAGDAVQEAIRNRRVNDAVLDEEDAGAARLGYLTAIVEHHRIGMALGFRSSLEVVQIERPLPRRLTAPSSDPGGDIRRCRTDPLQLFSRIEAAAPLPDGDHHVDAIRPGGHIHHFAAAPCDRLQVGFR